jgi:hypothetical protein
MKELLDRLPIGTNITKEDGQWVIRDSTVPPTITRATKSSDLKTAIEAYLLKTGIDPEPPKREYKKYHCTFCDKELLSLGDAYGIVLGRITSMSMNRTPLSVNPLYIEKKETIHTDEQFHFFCCEECARKFIAEHSKPKPHVPFMFRGKTIRGGKKWIRGSYISHEGRDYIVRIEPPFSEVTMYEIDPESLGVYIGEKDDMSRPIFGSINGNKGSDIVDSIAGIKAIFNYNKESYGFRVYIDRPGYFSTPWEWFSSFKEKRVIGNMTDNPELFKNKE